jgi:uncharacterized membrane protein YhaH (DUF805 family)
MADQNVLTIKPQKRNALYLVLLCLGLAIFTYFVVTGNSQRTNYWLNIGTLVIIWLILCVAVMRQLFYAIGGRNMYDDLTVKLTPQGFYKGDTLYRWHDIDYFGVKKEYTTLFSFFCDRRVVYWNYKPSSTVSQFRGKIFRLLLGYDDALNAIYEIDSDDFAKLLNEWKIRYTGQLSEIETEARLNRKLTTKEVIFALAFTLFLIFAIVAVTALYMKK